MLYRILTEDKGKKYDKFIVGIVLTRFEGFNISRKTGYYKGQQEKSLVIEIDTLRDDNRQGILSIARAIKDYLKQECILIQAIDSDSRLV